MEEKKTLRQILAQLTVVEVRQDVFEVSGKRKRLDHEDLSLLMHWVSEFGEPSKIVGRYHSYVHLELPEGAANHLRKQIEMENSYVNQSMQKVERLREGLVRMCVTKTNVYHIFHVRGWDLESIKTAQEVVRSLKGWAAERGGAVEILGKLPQGECNAGIIIKTTKRFADKLQDILNKQTKQGEVR